MSRSSGTTTVASVEMSLHGGIGEGRLVISNNLTNQLATGTWYGAGLPLIITVIMNLMAESRVRGHDN